MQDYNWTTHGFAPKLFVHTSTDLVTSSVKRTETQSLLAAHKTSIVTCTNGTDCTVELQAALYDVTASHVIVPHNRGQRLWYTRPLLINRSNLALTLEPGVVIQAVCGAFQSGHSELLRASGAHNPTIRGEGAALRMWRSDYANVSLYKHSEHKHGLSFKLCHNVTVSRLEIAETGGGGVYIKGIIGGVFRKITTDGEATDPSFSSPFLTIQLPISLSA